MMQKKDRMGSAKISCNENSEGDETLWLYDHATGLVTNKVYADGSRVVYTHAADGKPLRTTLTRGVWKENAYDALGQLTTVTYGGKVPKVSLARNAFGTVTNVSCASGLVYGFAVNDRQIVTNETVVSGASTNTLTRLLDAFDRPDGLLLDSGYALFYGRNPAGKPDYRRVERDVCRSLRICQRVRNRSHAHALQRQHARPRDDA